MATNFSGRRLDRDGLAGTMEGAVRSGYLAAEAITESFGNRQKFVVPDLPAKGLMKLL